MILISHITGNTNSRQAMLSLVELGLLAEAHTTLCWDASVRWQSWLPESWLHQARRRSFPDVVIPFLRTHPLWELLRLASRYQPLFPGFKPRMEKLLGIDALAKRFDLSVARRVAKLTGLKAVYAYEDAALETFTAAKRNGLTTFYELPTPYWRTKQRLLNEERNRQPEWACLLPDSADTPEKLARKDAELELADHIIVPSAFVQDSLKESSLLRGEVHVIPYGVDPPASMPTRDTGGDDHALRLLYVGNLGQAKGLSYLADAMKRLPCEVKLTLIGGPVADVACPALEAFLSSHEWLGRLSNSRVLEIMPDYDVLILPTLYEGLAIVLLEAMSRGLTVITTDHSGLQGMVEHGSEGFVVPVRDSSALVETISILQRERKRLALMKNAARVFSSNFSAEVYRTKLGALMKQIVASC